MHADMLEILRQDLKYAARSLRRAPAFSFACVLTLALGIGANTALFTIVRGVILSPLPVDQPEELVEFACFRVGAEGYDPCQTSYPGFRTFLEEQNSLTGVFGFASVGELNAVVGDRAELVRGLLVSGWAYNTLGVRPVAGRLLDVQDDAPGAPLVAVLSEQFWMRRFGREAAIVGRTIRVNGEAVTIVGVTPSSFRGLGLDDVPDVTMALVAAEQFRRPGSLTAQAAWWVRIIGRLPPGANLEQAEAALAPTYHRTLQETAAALPPEAAAGFREFVKGFRFRLRPAATGADSYVRGTLERPMRILWGIVLIVLLIACTNMAGLLLSRAIDRRHEFGLRLALGAGRASLIRQVVLEAVILAALGGAMALAFSTWAGPALLALGAGERVLRAVDLRPDVAVFAFTGIVSLACGIGIGLAAMHRAASAGLQEAWRTREAGGRSTVLASALIAAQVALAVVLLDGAVLFARSLANVRSVDPGFVTDNLVTLAVSPGLAGYDSERRLAYLEEAVGSLTRLPGVASASFAARPLATGIVSQTGIGVAGFQPESLEDSITGQNRVGPRFVETLGLTLLHGRDVQPGDDASSSSAVAVVNQSFAQHFFGRTNVVGQEVLLPSGVTCTVVGVVRDARDRRISAQPERWMYLPFAASDVGQSARLFVRTSAPALPFLALLPQALNRLDPTVPVHDVQTVAAEIEDTLGTRHLLAILGQLFGGLAVLLVGIGLYAMFSGMVSRRTREIGVRMAVGANRTAIGWLFARHAVAVAAVGLAVGVVGALGASRSVRGQLFGVAPEDPSAMAAAAILVLTAGVLAVWLPMRRAARIDPIVTLRWE